MLQGGLTRPLPLGTFVGATGLNARAGSFETLIIAATVPSFLEADDYRSALTSGSGLSGNRTVKVAPSPGWLSTVSLPP